MSLPLSFCNQSDICVSSLKHVLNTGNFDLSFVKLDFPNLPYNINET